MAERSNILDMIGRVFARATQPAVPGQMQLTPIGNVIAGVRMNDPAEALKVSTVFRCVSLVSQSLAMLPWNVYTRDKSGEGVDQPDSPIKWLLSSESNEELNAFDFRQSIESHVMLEGNGYAEIERDLRGRPSALWLLEPNRVTPARRNSDGALVYKVRQSGGDSIVLEAQDMYHRHGLAWDGIRGFSVLETALRTISAAAAMDEVSVRFFGQGMHPGGILRTKGKLSADGLTNLMKVFADRVQGLRNFWKPIPLDNDMEWQQTQVDMVDAQFLDLRKFSVTEICRWFGVPPHLAMDLDRATFSNIESQGREFLTYGLLPRIVPAEQEANKKLLNHSFGGSFTKMNVNAFQRGDASSRGVFYQTMINMGVMSVNEIRALEDMNSIGPEGDVHVRQMQYVPIDKNGNTAEPAPTHIPAPAQPATGARRK